MIQRIPFISNNIYDFINRLSDITGRLAAVLFFSIGLFIAYEVIMRYLFTAPTIWVDETARILQVWATYLGLAYTLKHHQMIVIDIVPINHNHLLYKLTETFSIFIIFIFSIIVSWQGIELWQQALLRNHTSDSLLVIPKWLTHAAVWIGFMLLALQCIIEWFTLWTVKKEHYI